MNYFKSVPILVLLLCSSFAFICSAESQQKYSISIVPQFHSTITHEAWYPYLSEIKKVTGVKLEIKLYENFDTFLYDIKNAVPDFIYMNPYHAVLTKKLHGYQPILRDDKRLLSGIIMVKKSSEIHSIEQLKGQSIAFPSLSAFGASLYLRALLANKEGIDINPVYVGTHSNGYRSVLRGQTVAAGGVVRTLSKESASIQSRLRILYITKGVKSHPISVHPRVPESVWKKIQKATIDFGMDTTKSSLVDSIQLPMPVKSDYESDYRDVENMNLDMFMD